MPEERTKLYSQQLAALVRQETVSQKNQTEKSKFYTFQQLLWTQIPNLFACCEYEDFDGSFLLRWKGSGNSAPVMLDEPIGGAKGTFAMIGLGEKGCADLKFVARSSGGHASTPGKNTPLVRLGKFMAAVETVDLFPADMHPVIQEMFRRIAATMPQPLNFILGHPQWFKKWLAQRMPGWMVILFIYLVVLVMNFFIPSGSAKAFMLIPLIVPLAQVFGLSAQLCVVAFAFGDGFSNVFYPTNPALLISLDWRT